MEIGVNSNRCNESMIDESATSCCKCLPFITSFFKKKAKANSETIPEQEMHQSHNFIDLLPTEVILEVSKYLLTKDLINFRATSKRHYQILGVSSLIWHHFLSRDFPSTAKIKGEKTLPYEVYKKKFIKAKDNADNKPKVEHFYRIQNDNQPRVIAVFAPPFFAGVFVYR